MTASIGRRLLRASLYYGGHPRQLLRRLTGKGEPEAKPTTSIADILGSGNPLVCIDIGGAGDLQPHWHRMVGSAEFIVYEPHRESFEKLIQRQAQNPRYAEFKYINTALSESGGVRTLYCTNVPTGSSLMRPKIGGFSDYERNLYLHPYSEMQIETESLKTSLDQLSVRRVDMIKLDTQGSELEILRGLDDARFEDVLLVESELSVLDHYDGGERNLEDALPMMRSKGFSLFELRTARFVGNALRYPPEAIKAVVGDSLDLPPNAQRLNEVDAIFVRDPRILISQRAGREKLRRLIGALIAYNFFPEAVFTVLEAKRHGIFGEEAQRLLASIKSLNEQARADTQQATDAIRSADGMMWAQYMWVPYPSF